MCSVKHDTDFCCYVDSLASVALLDRECGQADAVGPLDVLLEVGYLGGRTGVRSLAESLAVARAVNRSTHLRLVGVAGFEGLMPGGAADTPAGLEAYLEPIARTARELNAAGLFGAGRIPVVTAGGSSYFDQVVACLGPDCFDFPVQTVLRSGCYLTHDHGIYTARRPLLHLLGDEAVRRFLRLDADRRRYASCRRSSGRVLPGIRRQRKGAHHRRAGDAAHRRLSARSDGTARVVRPRRASAANVVLDTQLGAGYALRIPSYVGALGAGRGDRSNHGKGCLRRARRAHHHAGGLGADPRHHAGPPSRDPRPLPHRRECHAGTKLEQTFGVRALPETECDR